MASRARTELIEFLERLLERLLVVIGLILQAVGYVLACVLGLAAIVATPFAVYFLLDWCIGPKVAQIGTIFTIVGIGLMLGFK